MARLLIVDDSFTARGMLSRLIGTTHTIEHVDSGAAALDALSKSDYDLVLLDLLMPGMDGLAVLAAIRQINRKLPVIIVSADIQESTKKRVLEAGATAIVYKPPKREELIEAIRKALGETIS